MDFWDALLNEAKTALKVESAVMGAQTDAPVEGDTPEDATARSPISLLKRIVNKLIDIKAKLPSFGTVGNPSADVITVQGDADGTPVPVSEPDTAAASAGEAVNISAADHTCSATTRALYVGGGGDVIATVGGVDLTFKDVPGGTILPIAATVIKDESTATYMVALW